MLIPLETWRDQRHQENYIQNPILYKIQFYIWLNYTQKLMWLWHLCDGGPYEKFGSSLILLVTHLLIEFFLGFFKMSKITNDDYCELVALDVCTFSFINLVKSTLGGGFLAIFFHSLVISNIIQMVEY